jgi:hypothetical protein
MVKTIELTTPQQQEYIITEDEKQRVDGWLSSMGKTTIRSRPAPAPQAEPLCICQLTIEQCHKVTEEIKAEAAATERENTIRKFETEWNPFKYSFMEFVRTLRSTQEQP